MPGARSGILHGELQYLVLQRFGGDNRHRAETGRQAFGIDAVNEFDPLFEDIYDYSDSQRLDIDTLSHEAGAAQMEINFNHGDPLELADQAFVF